MSQDSRDALPFLGALDFGSDASQLRSFVRSQIIKGIRTSQPVEVIGVSNSGGVSPIGTVDIRPLVQQIDAYGRLYSHEIIYNVPYLRIQGGSNAVIIDPEVGDIGMASFCDRDMSSVKENQAESGPGSKRMFDMSDAVYHSSIMSLAAPDQYVQFNDSGITVNSPNSVTVRAPNVTVDADSVTVNGMTVFTDPVTFQSNVTFDAGMSNQGSDVSRNHTHGGVESGPDTSGPVNS